jgi:predicted nuclease of restriction endonuclease-like (RecB) superfamily
MRALAAAYPEEPFVQQVAAQLPWFHLCVLLDKLRDPAEREWYIQATIADGWSRTILVHQIESGLYGRPCRALTNFERTLPAPRSELAQQVLKDPYSFDFLSLGAEAHERDLLLELGVGFACVGRQVHLEVGGEDFYLDLLFYHLRLRCYVVIDLRRAPSSPRMPASSTSTCRRPTTCCATPTTGRPSAWCSARAATGSSPSTRCGT